MNIFTAQREEISMQATESVDSTILLFYVFVFIGVDAPIEKAKKSLLFKEIIVSDMVASFTSLRSRTPLTTPLYPPFSKGDKVTLNYL